MNDVWTTSMYRDAVEALYQFERGKVVKVTSFIRSLQTQPLPEGAEPVTNDAQVYRYIGDGFQIIFELIEREKVVRILGLRKYQPPSTK